MKLCSIFIDFLYTGQWRLSLEGPNVGHTRKFLLAPNASHATGVHTGAQRGAFQSVLSEIKRAKMGGSNTFNCSTLKGQKSS